VVLNNNRRHLDPEEFSGVLRWRMNWHPLVFINAADTKAAQDVSRWRHELAHVWLGQSALSDAQASLTPGDDVERLV